MKESTQKEKVLKKVRDALVNAMDAPFGEVDQESSVLHQASEDSLDIDFAEAFTRVHGKFIFCAGREELIQGLHVLYEEKQLQHVFCGEDFFRGLLETAGLPYTDRPEDLPDCQASLTGCEVLIARSGSVVMSSRQGCGRKAFVAPPLHIVVASSRQLVRDIGDALAFIDEKHEGERPSMISLVTRPSRTADIEKKLVLGAHGPGELYLFLVDTHSRGA